MKKLDYSDLKLVTSFISEMQEFCHIPIYQNKRNIKKLQNSNTKMNPTNTKNQNQINILKKVSIKILYDKSILKLRTKGTE